jgi:hypothetical protein
MEQQQEVKDTTEVEQQIAVVSHRDLYVMVPETPKCMIEHSKDLARIALEQWLAKNAPEHIQHLFAAEVILGWHLERPKPKHTEAWSIDSYRHEAAEYTAAVFEQLEVMGLDPYELCTNN